jgi:hypothetical protein
MAQKVMYPGMVNSPETTITNGISESDTIIYVLDPARVPTPPNLMTLGTGTNAETVKVTEINDSAITVERGFQGIAKAWPAGTVIARNFTEYDYNALKENIEDLEANKETPAGAQAKADEAEAAAKAYADQKVADLAGEGRTTETVKGNADALGSHLSDKVTDATKNPHGAFTEFSDRAVNVKWFGAVGDGVTDDTEALQDALSSLGNSGGLVFVPAGTYLFNETLVIGAGQTITGVGNHKGSTLLYTGTGSAVDISSEGCLSKIEVKKDPSLWTGDWNLANPVSGVRLTGSKGRAEDIRIWGFEIGLHLIGAGGGCAYNQVFLRQIYNCHKAIVLDATTVDSVMGWVNENTIYGGTISIDSTYTSCDSYPTTWGIYMDCHTAHYPNNNKFIGNSIEGVNNGIRIVGRFNALFNPRIEIPGTVKIVFKNLTDSGSGVCAHNWVFGLYGFNDFGTNVLVKKVDDSDELFLNENMIIGSPANSLPLQMTNDSLYFRPSYRRAMIKYNVTDYCFEFWQLGNKIATLDSSGNLKVKGTVSENQTF